MCMHPCFLSAVYRDCSERSNPTLEIDSLDDDVDVTCFGDWNIIMQHRHDLDINGNWSTMRQGYNRLEHFDPADPPSNQLWLGNEAMYQLTSRYPYILRIDMWTDEHTYEYAEYDGFSVANEDDSYTLTLTNYRAGSAGPGGMVTYHSGKPFATADRDNGMQCSYDEDVAWWFMDDDDVVFDVSNGIPREVFEGKSQQIVVAACTYTYMSACT